MYESAIVWVYPICPVLSKCLSERINWIISRIPHRISKIIFVYGSYEFLSMLEGKIRETPFFFKVQSGKMTVCTLCDFLFSQSIHFTLLHVFSVWEKSYPVSEWSVLYKCMTLSDINLKVNKLEQLHFHIEVLVLKIVLCYCSHCPKFHMKKKQASITVDKFHAYLKCRIWIHHQKSIS